MTRILITGGAGYIRSHVNKMLTRKGYATFVLDNLTRGSRQALQWGTFVEGDLADMDQVRAVFRLYSIDAVVHLAAFAYVGESMEDPHIYYRNNVANTVNLLQGMREFNVNNLILSSTCAVYGIPETLPIPENHPLHPINPYGRSKLTIENILADYSRAYDLKYFSLRYFNAAGADPELEIGERHDPEPHLIPSILEVPQGLREHVDIYGTNHDTPDGTCIRDYIHVWDIAGAHILALEHLMQGGGSETVNLGNEQGFSVWEVIECAREVTGKDIRARVSERRLGDPPVLTGSNEKARKVLGWRPDYPELWDIVRTAWEWKRKEASPA